ncbi:MAG: response regulator [Proteobacteria bacterium]|nr:response regulator [Pseudomonadota bacterium]
MIIYGLITRFGIAKSAFFMSVLCVLVSLLLFFIIAFFAGGYTVRPVDIFASLIIPAFIAPPVCIILLRIVNLLYQARADLLKAQEELEKKVAERTRELTNTNELLREEIEERKRMEEERNQMEALLIRAKKMEVVGMLAGGVAHDLNNILGGLVTYPDFLIMQLPPDSPMRKPLLTIKNSGERAAAIVQDLLALTRRGVVTKEPLNLNEIISEYLATPEHQNMLKQHPDIQVEEHLDKHLLNILGSPGHLLKTLTNLLSNAVESMPAGGVISIATGNRHMDRPVKGYDYIKQGDYVTLIVSDTGTGIPPEHSERIFEPFFTKKVMGISGTGLGLTLVWGTVKDHEGYISVDSVMEKGTTFTLYFPVTRQAQEGKDHAISIQELIGQGEKILVIDDMEDQREIAAKILTSLGYSPATVPSGEEAIEYLKGHSVDLILIDMIMYPGMDGLETYKEILKIHPGQKAIIVSGFSETDHVKDALRLGVGEYVKKPYQIDKIGLAIKTELKKPPTN